MISAVFDFDGTLVNTMPELEELAVKVLSPYVPAHDIRSWYRRTSGQTFAEQLYDLTISPQVQEIAYRNFQQGKADIQLRSAVIREVVDFAAELAAHGAMVGVCSSTEIKYVRPTVSNLMSHVGFQVVSGIESGSKVEQLAQFRLLAPGPWLFVGDSQWDRELARRGRMEFLDADFVVKWRK